MDLLIPPTKGQVTFDGDDIFTKEHTLYRDLCRRMNTGFQDTFNFAEHEPELREITLGHSVMCSRVHP